MSLLRSMLVVLGIAAGIASPLPATAQTAVTGRNVTVVQVATGRFTMTAPQRWLERGDDGKTFNFVETSRTDWTVQLSDASRGVNLSLDLKRKMIFYADTTSPWRPLYPIVSASTAAPQGQAAAPKSPAPAPSAPQKSPSDPGFADEIVNAHNEVRTRHGAPPLRWSANLARTANAWAQSMKSKGCTGGHSGQAGVGENLSWSGSSAAQASSGAGKDAVRRWYWCEIGQYDARSPGFSNASGHYTQVVWASTTEVGCAVVSCGPSEQKMWPGKPYSVQVVVCQYGPPGNVQDSFPQNVKHISPGTPPAGVRCG